MYTPKIAIIFDHIQEPQWLLSTVDYAWKTNQAEFFAFDKFTLQNLVKDLVRKITLEYYLNLWF